MRPLQTNVFAQSNPEWKPFLLTAITGIGSNKVKQRWIKTGVSEDDGL